MTMRFSLEGRVPLLDNAVADLALSLPADMKLHGTTTKFVFKQAVRDLLPPGVRRQRKHGFAIPVASWMRGELHHTARRLLLSPKARNRGITNPVTVTALLDSHAAGTGDHGHLLYSLLVLEVWFRLHVDTTPSSACGLTLDEI